MKPLHTRIDECINIKTQLESLGVLVLPEYKQELSQKMNDYIKLGEPQQMNIKLDNVTFEITLSSKKSGVLQIIF